jgi:hypothetical protein
MHMSSVFIIHIRQGRQERAKRGINKERGGKTVNLELSNQDHTLFSFTPFSGSVADAQNGRHSQTKSEYSILQAWIT